MRLVLSRSLALTLLACVGWAIGGCAAAAPGAAAGPSTKNSTVKPAGKTAAAPSARNARATPATEPDAAAIEEQVDAQSQRLIDAIEASKRRQESRLADAAAGTDSDAIAASAPVEPKPTRITWVDPRDLRAEVPVSSKPAAAAGTTPAAVAAPADKPADAGVAKPAPDAGKPAPDLDRETLVKLLRQRIADSGDGDANAALSYAALALADPSFKLDPAELGKMKPSQRELAKQFHELFSTLGQQVATGQSIDRGSLTEKINAIIGEQPMSLRSVKLCERVRGFGVYEELATDTFLAGREHPMVIYVEVDHFKSARSETGNSHQVKLSQELVLYNESDGLAVWQQPEEQIIDESRNKRRDFFIVQPTRLPSRLGVGKYVLKVRVRDLQGGTRDEVSVPINIVADPTLVRPTEKKVEKRG